jgi:hypothetical protein
LHELDADEHDSGAGNEWGKDLAEDARRREGHADCEEGAACCGPEDRAVSIWTW